MSQILYGFGMVGLYFVVFVRIILLIRKLFAARSERFRKTLHMGALFSIFVFLYAFKVWWHAVIVCLVLIIIIFPVLHFAEKVKGYSTLLVQRKPHEVKWRTGTIGSWPGLAGWKFYHTNSRFCTAHS